MTEERPDAIDMLVDITSQELSRELEEFGRIPGVAPEEVADFTNQWLLSLHSFVSPTVW
jgi:hypothetical protein